MDGNMHGSSNQSNISLQEVMTYMEYLNYQIDELKRANHSQEHLIMDLLDRNEKQQQLIKVQCGNLEQLIAESHKVLLNKLS